jgi:hypothetical protein
MTEAPPENSNKTGHPQIGIWCLLHVRDLKNAFGWTGPAIGMWNGEQWLIRQYDQTMTGSSFKTVPAEGLDVVGWSAVNRPRFQFSYEEPR